MKLLPRQKRMCKVTEIQNDKWFFDNGYFKKHICTQGTFIYDITIPTEKWRKLFDSCIASTPKGQIITQEILFKTISGETKRAPKKSYRKLTPEERLANMKERQRVKALNIKIKNANRNT